MGHWRLMLAAGTLGCAALLGTAPGVAAVRTVSFRVSSACDCAECAFCARKEIPKIPGVKQSRLSVKDRRLDVTYDDAEKPISSLAQAIGRTDLGKGCSLVWSVPAGADAKRVAAALAGVQGVASARIDAKAGVVLLTFSTEPPVSFLKLEAASKEGAHVAS